jgi:ATP-dependent RNA helicase RhlE
MVDVNEHVEGQGPIDLRRRIVRYPSNFVAMQNKKAYLHEAAVQSVRLFWMPRPLPLITFCIGVRLPPPACSAGSCACAVAPAQRPFGRERHKNVTKSVSRTAAPAAASNFADFAFGEPIAAALASAKFVTPTPIQAQAIPPLLQGRDIIAIAQTGTGKTAAFALPMLQQLLDNPRRLDSRTARMIVLSPTRELAVQIADSFRTLGQNQRFALSMMFGGVSERGQIMAAQRGIDVLIATPGRLVDLVERNFLKLDRTEVFVLDEADRMLDMGFVREVKKLVRLLPKSRQSLMFSATMPPAIREIAEEMLKEPVRVAVTPEVVTVEKIDQSVYFVPAKQKRALLLELLTNEALKRVVVFCRTKHGANKVAEFLDQSGVKTGAIHGNKSQGARQAALNAFKSGNARVLVATDIVARGIDVPGITHVINYELPNEPESYVHRIGRTARAGKEGSAISFCDGAEKPFLKQIERLTKVQLEQLRLPELPVIAETKSAKRERSEERRDERPRQGERRPNSPRGDRRPARQEQGEINEARRDGRREDRFSQGKPHPFREHRGGDQRSRPSSERPQREQQDRPQGDRPEQRQRHEGHAFRRDEHPRSQDRSFAPRDMTARDGQERDNREQGQRQNRQPQTGEALKRNTAGKPQNRGGGRWQGGGKPAGQRARQFNG